MFSLKSGHCVVTGAHGMSLCTPGGIRWVGLHRDMVMKFDVPSPS